MGDGIALFVAVHTCERMKNRCPHDAHTWAHTWANVGRHYVLICPREPTWVYRHVGVWAFNAPQRSETDQIHALSASPRGTRQVLNASNAAREHAKDRLHGDHPSGSAQGASDPRCSAMGL